MKKIRPHAVDFSEAKHGRITDSSFAPSCDVNNIIRHYQTTGVDPYEDRRQRQLFGEAGTLSFDEAMRINAELNSKFAELPHADQVRHDYNPLAWIESFRNAQIDAFPDPEPEITPETRNSDGKSEAQAQ